MPYARDPNFPVDEPRRFRNGNGWGGALGEAGQRAMAEAGTRTRAWLTAWDPVRQREAWRVDQSGLGGGTLATAGNLVVQGTADQTLAIYRADTGEKLWEALVQTRPVAGPISYAVDGEQYIAINAGWGGGMAAQAGGGPGAANRAKGRMLAFKLGAGGTLPPLREAAAPPPEPPPVPDVPAAVLERGNALYHRSCAGCHGMRAVGGGVIPDLRHMDAAAHAAFDDVVLRGTRAEQGMIAFGDTLSEDDAAAIRAYVIERANEAWNEE